MCNNSEKHDYPQSFPAWHTNSGFLTMPKVQQDLSLEVNSFHTPYKESCEMPSEGKYHKRKDVQSTYCLPTCTHTHTNTHNHTHTHTTQAWDWYFNMHAHTCMSLDTSSKTQNALQTHLSPTHRTENQAMQWQRSHLLMIKVSRSQDSELCEPKMLSPTKQEETIKSPYSPLSMPNGLTWQSCHPNKVTKALVG